MTSFLVQHEQLVGDRFEIKTFEESMYDDLLPICLHAIFAERRLASHGFVNHSNYCLTIQFLVRGIIYAYENFQNR